MTAGKLETFVAGIPKGENHLHMVGVMQPDFTARLAKRNGMELPGRDVLLPHEFSGLTDFIRSYVIAASTLQTIEDYRDLVIYTGAEAKRQNIVYRECMFTDSCHMGRGISMDTMFNGLRQGRDEMHRRGVDMKFIAAIDRSESPEKGLAFVEGLASHRDIISAVGLDGPETGFPPEIHEKAFHRARELGFIVTAHAGEEGGPDSILGALDTLGVSRIDHGVRAVESPELVRRLADIKIMLTTCPLSNISLKVYPDMMQHPLQKLYAAGCAVTVNSDDPAFFHSNLNDNYVAIIKAFQLTKEEIHQIAANAFRYSLADAKKKADYLKKLDDYFLSTPGWDVKKF